MPQIIPFACLALSLALQSSSPPASAPNTLTAAEKAAGWQLLFDGRSLDGWRGYRRDALPEAGWEVEIRGDEYLILRERDVHAVASERDAGQTGLYL